MTLDVNFDSDSGEYLFGGTMHFKAGWNDGDTIYVFTNRAVNPATEMVYDPAVTVVQDEYSQSYGWRLQIKNVNLGKDHDVIFKDLRTLIVKMVETGWHGQGPDRGMVMSTAEFYGNISLDTAASYTGNLQSRGRSIEGDIADFSKFVNRGFDLLRLAYYDDGPFNGWYYANITGSLEDLADGLVANGRTGGTLTVRYYNKMIKRYNSDTPPTAAQEQVSECDISFSNGSYTIGAPSQSPNTN